MSFYYETPTWRDVRERVISEAGHKCSRCGKRNLERVDVTRGGYWWDEIEGVWRDDRGNEVALGKHATIYTVKCIITVLPLDGNPANTREGNLVALCQRCRVKASEVARTEARECVMEGKR